MPAVAVAQSVSVDGRVLQARTGVGIALAVVELEGHASVLTSGDGSFRFEDVEPGGYQLRVVAFGYAARQQFIVVDRDTEVDVALEIAPVRLDSLFVGLETIDLEGRARGADRDHLLVGADVLTNLGRATTTDEHGRFDFEAVPAGVPLELSIRAFGYLPLDTMILPAEDARYELELEVDSVVAAMVEVQVERLEDRAAPRFVALMRNMNRERLLRYAGSHTLWDVLLWEYGERRLDRVGCVVIDERVTPAGPEARSILLHMLPEELERVEFMFGGGMLRVYSRNFMQQMTARDVELRRPFMVGGLCG